LKFFIVSVIGRVSRTGNLGGSVGDLYTSFLCQVSRTSLLYKKPYISCQHILDIFHH